MIRFDNVLKTYRVDKGQHVVLDYANAAFPTGSRMGVLGPNGAGKSTLLRLIAGSELPQKGRITTTGRVSFPVGFTGTFHPRHSARENVRFLAFIYGMNTREVTEWIEDFAELGRYFDEPVSTYSSGMFARVAFATSFAFDFDIYLVDEAIEVGDANFRAKCGAAFAERMKTASLVLVSQNVHTIRQYCQSGAVLYGGKLQVFASVDEALDVYEKVMRVA